ncbi:heme o synthase [Ureibacillus manganicus]|uniref:Protoheme IX farnesyltransferase n=1 Tax=Ureibacillus manganicus DSM 26584 TaxID=1384049 RepID=A0A0A3HZK3_9BACL|nr:heme o synthase [Ureibacillus manganicus]KGR78031.1 protoheme IX farnesyltransferase [Ureibacillus manganicus DSM 26584]
MENGQLLADSALDTTAQSSSKLLRFLIDIKFLLKGKVLVANVLPVFTAYWLALYFHGERFVDYWGTFLLTMLGSTLVISGALMLNNWYEVDLDKKMVRTQNRPTVNGHFALKAVLWSGIITTIIGLVMMLFTTIEATLYSFLGWFIYVVLYTFWSKRRYTLNTVVGSVSGAFTPLIGWAVIAPANHIVPIVMFCILFIWQVPHTFAVAIKRLEDYTRAGVPMLPVVYGVDVTIRQNLIYIITLLPFPFLLITSLGWIFFFVAIVLTIGWIILAAKGSRAIDVKKWAQANLRYSLIYLVLLSLVMILLTSPIFN